MQCVTEIAFARKGNRPRGVDEVQVFKHPRKAHPWCAFFVGGLVCLPGGKGARPPTPLALSANEHSKQVAWIIRICQQIQRVEEVGAFDPVTHKTQGRKIFDRKSDTVENRDLLV